MVKNLLKNGRVLILRRQTNILSAAFVIMVAYATSGVLGLLRNRLLAATFFGGRESQLDAYFAAFVIPDTLFQLLITGALSAAFIPVFSQYLKRGEKEASDLASTSINVFTLLLLILIIIVFLFSSSLSKLIAPSLSTDNLILLSNLLRIMLTAQLFFAFSGFITGIIQSHQRFLIPALSPIVYNLGIIAGILFLSTSFGIYGPALGVVVGAVLHLLIQIPLARKLGFSYSFRFKLGHPGLKQIRKLMPLRSLTLAAGQVERFIAVSIATSLAAGSLTVFNFARQLYLLPITLFGTTIGQASFPTLSSEIASEKHKEFQDTLTSALLQVLYFSLPAAIIVLTLRVPIVRIAFGARNFPWEATLLTSKTVAFLAIAIPFMSLTTVLNRAFYAMHNTKTPLIIAAFSAALTIILSIGFAQSAGLGVIGLAIALAITNSIQAITLLLAINNKIPIITSKLIFSIVKIIIATATTGVFLWAPMRVIDSYILDTTKTVNLLILTISVLTIGMFVYLNLSAVLRIEQLSEVIALGRKIGNWKEVLRKSEEMLESTSLEKPAN